MATTQSAPQLRPLSVGEQLDAAFKVVRQSFKTLAVCVLVVALPLNIVNTLIAASTRDNPFDLDTATNQVSTGTAVAGQLVSGLLSIVLMAIAAAACFRAVSAVYLGETPTVAGSLRFAAGRVLSVIWLSVLYTVGVTIGTVALIIPGIWLAFAWSVSYPALLAEGLGGAKALGRSYRLTKGRWWATFGALLVMFLIVLVISGILGLLFGATLIATLDNEAVAAVLTTIVNTLSSLITLPLYAAVLTIIYYDLRVRKEGFDLHLLAQSVGGEAPTSPENVAASSGLGGSEPSPGGFAPPQAPSQPPPSPGSGLTSGDPLGPPPERREDDGGASS